MKMYDIPRSPYRGAPDIFACAMHLEMASSRPAAEACDVQVAAESHTKRAIKSILATFMFPLLSHSATIKADVACPSVGQPTEAFLGRMAGPVPCTVSSAAMVAFVWASGDRLIVAGILPLNFSVPQHRRALPICGGKRSPSCCLIGVSCVLSA
jgi:hypothetical protein